MASTKLEVNDRKRSIGTNKGGRAMQAIKVTMTAGTVASVFIDKESFGLVNFCWTGTPAVTVQFVGRFRKDTGVTEGSFLIGDKNGVPITLDLSTGDALGSTFPLDGSAPFDEIGFILSGTADGDYYFGLAG